MEKESKSPSLTLLTALLGGCRPRVVVFQTVQSLISCHSSEVKPDHNKNLAQSTVDKTGRAKDNVKHGGTHESM